MISERLQAISVAVFERKGEIQMLRHPTEQMEVCTRHYKHQKLPPNVKALRPRAIRLFSFYSNVPDRSLKHPSRRASQILSPTQAKIQDHFE